MKRILPLLALCLLAPLPAEAKGTLVLIGGGHDQDAIMRLVGQLAGGPAARIAILPFASDDPARSGPAYRRYFRELGFAHADALSPGPLGPEARDRLQQAGALFFSGGDQSRLLKALDPAWRQAIREAWQRGALLAGTSAGAMVFGSRAILGGEPMDAAWYGTGEKGVQVGPGLDLWPGLVVDTHFSERGRLPRLAAATGPTGLGIGVDPMSAAVISPEGRLQAHGRGTVWVLPGGAGRPGPLSLRARGLAVLAPGESLEALPGTSPIAPLE